SSKLMNSLFSKNKNRKNEEEKDESRGQATAADCEYNCSASILLSSLLCTQAATHQYVLDIGGVQLQLQISWLLTRDLRPLPKKKSSSARQSSSLAVEAEQMLEDE